MSPLFNFLSRPIRLGFGAVLSGVLSMFLLSPVLASEDGFPLERAPDRSRDQAALQRGAQLFVNYCLNCHGAKLMRYNRLQDLGLTEDHIRNNLLFTGDKVGDMMEVSLGKKDAKHWFGAEPPDLSVIARAKNSSAGSGADWLYTYLRTFYKDPSRPTGWNNLVYPNVGMPHVLYELQGEARAKMVTYTDPHNPSNTMTKVESLVVEKPGTMTTVAYDNATADLVGFLVWMSDPNAIQRKQTGVWVLLFLSLLMLPCAWWLNRVYWRDIH